jgi:hypothetical protein
MKNPTTYITLRGKDIKEGAEYLQFIDRKRCEEAIEYLSTSPSKHALKRLNWEWQTAGAPIKGMSLTVQPAAESWCVARYMIQRK